MEIVIAQGDNKFHICLGLKVWFKAHGIDSPETLPRHHPLLVKGVRECSKKIDTHLSIFSIEGNEYRIINDRFYGERIETPNDVKNGWIEVSDSEVLIMNIFTSGAERRFANHLRKEEIDKVTYEIEKLQARLAKLNQE